jgi:hypothetical protein
VKLTTTPHYLYQEFVRYGKAIRRSNSSRGQGD